MMKDSTHQENSHSSLGCASQICHVLSSFSVMTQVQSFISPWTSIMPHHSSFPTQQPVRSSYNSDASHKKSPDSWTWCVHVAQSHLHCTRPSLLLPHRSSSTDVSSGLQAFGCAAAIVRSGLHSSPHSAGLNAAFSGKPSLPSLFWMRAPPVLALGRHLAYFIALFHTLSSLPLYLPADLSKVWAPWMHVLCIH